MSELNKANSPSAQAANTTVTVIIEVAPARNRAGTLVPASFTVKIGTRILVQATRQPLLDTARALLRLGFDRATRLILRHDGSNIDSISTLIGTAARLTVDEFPRPRFKALRAWDTALPVSGNHRGQPPNQPLSCSAARWSPPLRSDQRSFRRQGEKKSPVWAGLKPQ